jgi:GT2 family glycosyltransferase
MQVTVVIVNWNSGGLLKRCLMHLAAQTHKPDRILVLDNASTDNLVAGLNEFEVEFVQNEKNIGFAAANNLAIETVYSEYVVLLNPDAFPEPAWLESLLRAAENRQDFAAFGSRQLHEQSPDILDGVGDSYHLSGLPRRNRYGERQSASDLIEKEVFSACAAAVLYRIHALKEVGGFDENFFCYGEDIDLGFRLRLAGYKTLYVPEAVVMHVGSASTGGQHSDFAVYHGHRNLVWTYFKNMPGFLFWLFLPMHLVLNLVSLVHFSLRGQAGIIFKAKWHALLKLPRALRQRREIQVQRIASVWDIWRVLDRRFLPLR